MADVAQLVTNVPLHSVATSRAHELIQRFHDLPYSASRYPYLPAMISSLERLSESTSETAASFSRHSYADRLEAAILASDDAAPTSTIDGVLKGIFLSRLRIAHAQAVDSPNQSELVTSAMEALLLTKQVRGTLNKDTTPFVTSSRQACIDRARHATTLLEISACTLLCDNYTYLMQHLDDIEQTYGQLDSMYGIQYGRIEDIFKYVDKLFANIDTVAISSASDKLRLLNNRTHFLILKLLWRGSEEWHKNRNRSPSDSQYNIQFANGDQSLEELLAALKKQSIGMPSPEVCMTLASGYALLAHQHAMTSDHGGSRHNLDQLDIQLHMVRDNLLMATQLGASPDNIMSNRQYRRALAWIIDGEMDNAMASDEVRALVKRSRDIVVADLRRVADANQ